MLILSLLLCFKLAFANDIKGIEVVDELPDYLVKYRAYPWGLLKISKFRKKFNQVMKKSPEEKWVKEINLVANIGQAYRFDNHIVFFIKVSSLMLVIFGLE